MLDIIHHFHVRLTWLPHVQHMQIYEIIVKYDKYHEKYIII